MSYSSELCTFMYTPLTVALFDIRGVELALNGEGLWM